MRTLNRNKQQVYYALYEGRTAIKDEYGNETGESEISYSTPISLKINISPAKGESSTRQFGDSENYDRIMVTSDMECPIDENSILWIDTLDTEKPHDYIVKKVARSLNTISYAVSKVSISA